MRLAPVEPRAQVGDRRHGGERRRAARERQRRRARSASAMCSRFQKWRRWSASWSPGWRATTAGRSRHRVASASARAKRPRDHRVPHERLADEPRLGARLDRPPGEVGVLAAEVVGLVEAAEPLEQRRAGRPCCRSRTSRRQRARRRCGRGRGAGGARRGRGPCGPGGRRPGPSAAPSRASSQPGAARQSSSVNATSGASVARQPRLRFAVGPATPGRVR